MSKASATSDPKEVVAELKVLKDLFLECRSVFPTIGEGMVGQRQFDTPPYYMIRGYNARVELSGPITRDFIDRNRRLGKWINENAIIRLHGIMEHHGFLSNTEKIDQTIKGWKEVDLMRRMRNAFTKTPLNYKPRKQKNIQLRKEIIQHFGLRGEEYAGGEIPTPIDTVVEPIFEACCEYILAKSAVHNLPLKPTTNP